MNSLIVFPDELIASETLMLRGARAREFLREYGPKELAPLKFAVWGGDRGIARVLSRDPQQVELRVERREPSIPLQPIDLIVGLSRPQTVKKVIQAAVTFGVRSLHFVHSELGEKSYLTSHALIDEEIQREVVKGLEQIWSGMYPSVRTHRSFRYFCEHRLPTLGTEGGSGKFIAHPGGVPLTMRDDAGIEAACVVAVGCERGWCDEEVARFVAAGFQRVDLGPRVMRVELAVVCLLGQLQLLAHGR